MEPKSRALFLDRDGVINEDRHYPYKPEHIEFRPGIFDLCRCAVAKGYKLIVVTNQAGVAKGKFTEEDVRALHVWMRERFADESIAITAFYYCPFHKNGTVPAYIKDSDCRKPRPGMLLQAAEEHNIDLARSLMVGDKNSDRIEIDGLKCVILRSEYVREGYDVESLDEVVKMLK